MKNDVKGIILAAGRGSRMGSLTDELPKCMVNFQGKPLIEKQIASLKGAGIQDVGIVAGYQSQAISHYSPHIFINDKWKTTNMLYSLLLTREWLENYTCIISYSDIFYESDIVKALISNDDKAAISYDPNWLKLWSIRFADPLTDAESFKLKEDGFLKEIGTKANGIEEIEGQYMGLLKFTPHFWSELLNDALSLPQNISMTEFINFCLKKPTQFKAVKNTALWGEIDSPSDLELYKRMGYV